MTLAESMLPEFDHEMATTRKVLACVPEGKNDWKPHPKSMPLGRLAGHLAELVNWTTRVLEGDELDFAPPGGKPWEPTFFTTREGTLALFDRNVAAARAALAAAPDAAWMRDWSLKRAGAALFTMPRIAVQRTMVMNHIIHHRAQLGVYLRLLDVAIPGSYGPSADEKLA